MSITTDEKDIMELYIYIYMLFVLSLSPIYIYHKNVSHTNETLFYYFGAVLVFPYVIQ